MAYIQCQPYWNWFWSEHPDNNCLSNSLFHTKHWKQKFWWGGKNLCEWDICQKLNLSVCCVIFKLLYVLFTCITICQPKMVVLLIYITIIDKHLWQLWMKVTLFAEYSLNLIKITSILNPCRRVESDTGVNFLSLKSIKWSFTCCYSTFCQ